MAIAFDAASQNSTLTGNPQTFTHTGAAGAKGAILLGVHPTVSTDIVTGAVTYGGVAMTRFGTQSRPTGQQGRVYGYLLGSGLLTGLRTISIGRPTDTTTQIHWVVVTVTAAGDIELVHWTSNQASNPNPQVVLNSGGRTCLGLSVIHSGLLNVGDLVETAGLTRLFDHDYGVSVSAMSRQTTPGTGNLTMGYTAADDHFAILGALFSEVAGAGSRTGDLAASFNLAFSATGQNDVPLRVYAPRPALTVDHVELWTDVEANGGRSLGPVAQLLSGPVETVAQDGEHSLEISVAASHPIIRLAGTPADDENLRIDQVLRLIKTDGTWSEHRISKRTKQNQHGARTRGITARSILQDLAFRGIVSRTTADGASTMDFEALSLPMALHLSEFILPAAREAGAPFWDIGTLAHGLPVDMTYRGDTPLAALRKLLAAAGSAIGRPDLELDYEAGATRYLLHLTEQTGSAVLTPVTVRARRNLVDLDFTEQADDQATRVYATGAGRDERRPTLGEARWDVAGVTVVDASTIDIQLADPAGGEGPIKFDDQFVSPPGLDVDDPSTAEIERPPTYYLRYTSGGVFQAPIIASVAATQTVRVQSVGPASGSSFIGTPRAQIVADDPGRQILFVEHPILARPAGFGGYGVRVATLDRSDIPGTDNLIPNPVCRVWPDSSPLPTGWRCEMIGATVSRERSSRFWGSGGQAIRIRWAAIGGVGNSPLVAPVALVPLFAQGYLSYFLRVTTIAGRIKIVCFLERSLIDPVTGLPTAAFPWEEWRYVVPDYSGILLGDPQMPEVTSIQLNVPEDIGVAAAWDLNKYPLYGGTLTIQVQPAYQSPANTECVVEAVQATNTSEQMPLIEGNGGAKLHQAANGRLGLYSTPAPIVSVNLLDLAVADGLRFPYPSLALGVPIRIEDPDSLEAPVTTRVVGWTRDWRNRTMPQLQLSNERRDITAVLATAGQAPRHPTRLMPGGSVGLNFAS
jgi:hypothetical protein